MKKRLFSLFLCICFVMLLCSCGSKKSVKPVLSSVSFQADIEYYNEKYTCDVVLDGDSQMNVTVVSPDELKGMKIYFSNGQITVEYRGLTYKPSAGKLPLNMAISTLYGVVNSAKNGQKADKQDGNCLLKGKIDGIRYELLTSPSGFPISLSLPDKGATVYFRNVTMINDK